jgi:hypothetical protein
LYSFVLTERRRGVLQVPVGAAAATDLAGVPAAAYTRRFAWQAYIMEEAAGMGGCGPKYATE